MNRATAAWLASRGLRPESSEWRVFLDEENDAQAPTARFDISIDDEGRSFTFEHAGKASRIRLTDEPIIQEGDDFA